MSIPPKKKKKKKKKVGRKHVFQTSSVSASARLQASSAQRPHLLRSDGGLCGARAAYSPLEVRFGHLYKDGTDRRGIEGLVWQSIVTQLPSQLIAMDPQRLGTPTAAYDLHFQEQFLQQKHELSDRGFLTVEYLGKREQLPASTKGSQISPRYAEVVVKQLDPRWARKGVTTALLKAAGYSTDVAVKTEFAGDLPAHLSCWSPDLGRSDVTVAKVAAPASTELMSCRGVPLIYRANMFVKAKLRQPSNRPSRKEAR